MKKIIFRADDLGYSEGVNQGIAKTVKRGFIQTVGLIVNLEHSQEGFELIKEYEVCLGLHVNISYGKPVSDPLTLSSLVDENGMFKSSRAYNQASVDFVKYEEVYRRCDIYVGSRKFLLSGDDRAEAGLYRRPCSIQ